MAENQQSPFDLSKLEELIRYPALMSTTMLAGYPFCCLIFSRSWDGFPKHKKGVFSAAIGGGFTVIAWFVVAFIASTSPEYSSLAKDNMVTLTTALLLLIAMIEVILIAVRRSIHILHLKRRRANK